MRALESESVGIIDQMGLAREVMRPVLAELEENQSAQVNLLSAICAARF